MNKFLAKYGKASIFTLIVILCMSFLIHLFSVSSGYLQSIDRQALDRAENYAGEQAVQLQEQFGALKMRADYCASEVSEACYRGDLLLCTGVLPLWSSDLCTRQMMNLQCGATRLHCRNAVCRVACLA